MKGDNIKTQKVDVLAVMNLAAEALFEYSPMRVESPAGIALVEARAAVAELIESARFFEEESRKKYGDNTTGGSRLRSALARIGVK